MRRANIVSLTMGSAMLISAAAAIAGPPTGISYGGFSSTGGTISAACPATYSCGAAITGNGFFQRALTNAGGTTFYQTIVLPTGAAVTAGNVSGLAFADENFVQQGGGTGIADSSHLFQASSTSNPGNFTSDTAINSGWAQGAGSVITLGQSITDSTAFNLVFSLLGDGTNTTSLTITQDVDLGSPDKQKFDLRQLTASAAGTNTPLPATATPGTTVAWVSGNIIQAVWMGQGITTATTDQQLSGFQGYTNVTTGATVSYTDQTSAGPFNYDTTHFGTAPSF